MDWIFHITIFILILSGLIYCFLIMIFTWGWYRNIPVNPPGPEPGKFFFVSVIIAVRNEADRIIDLLNDLKVQEDVNAGMEVIIVDDHSTDQTAQLVSEYLMAHPEIDFRLIRSQGLELAGSKKAALTSGIHAARGDLILTTDADCRVGKNWVSSMMNCFKDPEKAMIIGPVTYLAGRGLFNQFQALEFLGMMASGAGAAKAGMPFICSGANLAYRRSTFLQVDGYSGNAQFISGDDVFLLHKIKKMKGRRSIGFANYKESIVRTDPVKGLRSFFRQRARWASKSKGYRDHTALTTAVSVYILSLSMLAVLILGLIHPPGLLIFCVAVLIKSVADLPLMLGATGLTGTRKTLRGYLFFQIIYPFYVLIAGTLSFIRKQSWN